MAKSIEPIQFLQFGGLNTSGHPLSRSASSAAKCDNLRVMPGGWLRLRGGRNIYYDAMSGAYLQFHQFQRADGQGNIEVLTQYSGGTRKWQRFQPFPGFVPTDLETIDTSHGITGNLQAITNVRNRCFFYNGQGVNAGGSSIPALSSWDGTQLRYVGLAVQPTTGITVSTGGVGFNNILVSLAFYVGLYNSGTGHFSNAIYAGTVLPLALADLTVHTMGLIGHVSHNAGELAELKYVFYSSLDGGQTPYLIMDATGVNPLTAPISATSKSLSITPNDGKGFFVDVTQEMPRENFPPRPMGHIAFANGRVYGILRPGGIGVPYAMALHESPKVVWSAAADDLQDRDFVGLPEESWPLANGKYMPTGDAPRFLTKGPNETNVLVMTAKGTFLLEETADGLHEWTTVSETEGISRAESYAATPYGSVWITQSGQLVILRPGTTALQVLSRDFQAVVPFGTVSSPYVPLAADYLTSPDHQIDRYQCWFSNSTALVYDFFLGGQAYTYSAQDFTGAKTVLDSNGMRFHLVAKEKIYTHEVDPLNGLVPAMDQIAAGTFVNVNGSYIGQWMAFGDSSLRKEFNQIDAIGDLGPSVILGTNAGVIKVYADLASAAATLRLTKTPQSDVDSAYDGKIPNPNRFWFKFEVQLHGHAEDFYGDPAISFQRYYPAPSIDGDLAPSVLGSLLAVRVTMSPSGGNR